MNNSSYPEQASQWPRDFDFRAEYAEQQELLQRSDEELNMTNRGSESDE